jgi:transposase-like protein
VAIATGVRADEHREALGCAVEDNETEAFWTEFLTDLRDRGPNLLQLVASDAHHI